MNNKVIALVDSLCKATQKDRVKWSPVLTDVFRAKVGPGHVTISHELEQNDEKTWKCIGLRISDAKGRIVENTDLQENSDFYPLFDGLFQAARRSAMSSDSIIDEMLAEIGK